MGLWSIGKSVGGNVAPAVPMLRYEFNNSWDAEAGVAYDGQLIYTVKHGRG